MHIFKTYDHCFFSFFNEVSFEPGMKIDVPPYVTESSHCFNSVFSRVAVIPFEQLSTGQNVVTTNCALQMAVKYTIPNIVKTIGRIIEFTTTFTNMESDPLWHKILEVVEKQNMWMYGQQPGTASFCLLYILYTRAQMQSFSFFESPVF